MRYHISLSGVAVKTRRDEYYLTFCILRSLKNDKKSLIWKK